MELTKQQLAFEPILAEIQICRIPGSWKLLYTRTVISGVQLRLFVGYLHLDFSCPFVFGYTKFGRFLRIKGKKSYHRR